MVVTAAIDEELRPFLEAFALSPDAVYVTDRRNRIVLWNKAVERLLGYTETEVVGYSCGGVLRGCDQFGNRYCSDACPVVQIANRGESVHRFELQLRAKDKQQLLVEITVLNVVGPQHHQVLLPHIIRPIKHEPAQEAHPPVAASHKAVIGSALAHRLTRRELEVLTMIASGLPSNDIAERLGIAPLTVRNHVQNVLDKLQVHSKAEAVAFAFKNELIPTR